MNRCLDRGERRNLNRQKFWNRVKRNAWWLPKVLDPENYKLRRWIADSHGCPCPLCRDASKKYHGNSRKKYSHQELKMIDDTELHDID